MSLVAAVGLKKHFPIRGGVLGKTVGLVKAVDGVDLEIPRGKTLGLVGESGCGKTTVGRCILRLLPTTAGEIFFDLPDAVFDEVREARARLVETPDGKVRPAGERRAAEEKLAHLSASHGLSRFTTGQMRRLRREMQIVHQDPFSSLNPRMMVRDIVGEPLTVHDVAAGVELRERTAKLLEVVGLNPEHLNRFPHEFSGGQRQRIAIARALALNPKFIVLDEPTSALDVSVQAQILNLLKELQEKFQLTYLFISHHLSVIRHVCDEVAVMYLGRIVEQAPTDELFKRPQHPYTEALLSAVPVPDPKRKTQRIVLEGDVPSPARPPEGCRFHPRCKYAQPNCKIAGNEPPLIETSPGHKVACFYPLKK